MEWKTGNQAGEEEEDPRGDGWGRARIGEGEIREVKKEEGGRTLYSPGSNILSITNGSNGVIVMDISK